MEDSACPPQGKEGAKTMADQRFLLLSDVSEILNISSAQTYALVRNGDLPAVKIGGRGQWRVEHSKLEEYIARMYDQTRRFVEKHPLGRDEFGPDELARDELDRDGASREETPRPE